MREIIGGGATYVQDEETTQERFRDYWLGRGGKQWLAVLAEQVVGGYTLRPNQRGRGGHVANGSYIVDSTVRSHGSGMASGFHSPDRGRALGFPAIQFNFVVSTNATVVSDGRSLVSRWGERSPGRSSTSDGATSTRS